MKRAALNAVAFAFCLFPADYLFGQAIVEYGKGLEQVRPPSGPGIKGSGSARRAGGTSQEPSAPLPPTVLPAGLTVKEDQAQLYAQQDEYSARVEIAPKGARLTPLGQATAGGEKWYLARTPQGTIGWVKAVAVEEIWPASAKDAKSQGARKPR
ncbi:MAG TPA: hypothetical protein VNL14_19235 [Candidatus Acidoferrales bacterium]|nr:hypothetical protein [Candidatus Acidoferrales bacterium]